MKEKSKIRPEMLMKDIMPSIVNFSENANKNDFFIFVIYAKKQVNYLLL
jgi:hypothetical protein